MKKILRDLQIRETGDSKKKIDATASLRRHPSMRSLGYGPALTFFTPDPSKTHDGHRPCRSLILSFTLSLTIIVDVGLEIFNNNNYGTLLFSYFFFLPSALRDLNVRSELFDKPIDGSLLISMVRLLLNLKAL